LINNYDTCGTLFAAGTRPASPTSFRPVPAGYLRRSTDYRSVLGEIIREHLGATQNQLNRIIPGYDPVQNPVTPTVIPEPELLNGGDSSVDGTPIRGEVGIL
jgi:hypothetical protein